MRRRLTILAAAGLVYLAVAGLFVISVGGLSRGESGPPLAPTNSGPSAGRS